MSTASLGDLRILDLAGPAGFYCTKLLADLGADVVRIEEPAADEHSHNGASALSHGALSRRHYHTNKRSLTLELGAPAAIATLAALAKAADVVVHTLRPVEAEARGLDPVTLLAASPATVVTTITPFGWSGPRRDFKMTDIVGQAMGGLLALTGLPEHKPYQVGGEQAYHMASLQAATGTLVALASRDKDGLGRHVDISIQDAVSLATLQTANLNFYMREGVVRRRGAMAGNAGRARAPVGAGLQRCRDGWIIFTIPPRHWRDFVRWLESFGVHDFSDPKYEDPEVQAAERERIVQAQAKLFSEHTAAEIYHSAQRHRLLCMPVQSVSDLLDDEQLAEREFFVKVEDAELGRTLTYPGAPYKLSATPWRFRRPAPAIGADSDAVLRDWLGAAGVERAAMVAGRAL